jgi:hypothetical protein
MSADKIQDTSAHGDLAAWDCSKYHVVEQNSNLQSSVTTGGEDHFVRNSGGGDDAGLRDSNLGAGGKSIA